MVQGAAERRHDGGPRARAGAAERVALVLRVVFMIRRRGRRRRLHLQMEAGCAFWPNARWGGSRAARFCAAGEGLPVSHLRKRLRAGARRAPRLVQPHDLVRCDEPSSQVELIAAGRERGVRQGVGGLFPVSVVGRFWCVRCGFDEALRELRTQKRLSRDASAVLGCLVREVWSQ